MGTACGVCAFFDIDGTLVYRDEQCLSGEPSVSVRAALNVFTEQGGMCVLCTGRPRGLVHPSVAALPWSGWITMDGACVHRDGKTVFSSHIATEIQNRLLDGMERLDVSAIFESDVLNVSLDRGDNWFTQVPSPTTAAGVRELAGTTSFAKVVFHDHELAKIQAHPEIWEGLVLYHLGDGMNELTVPHASKGSGVRAFLDDLVQTPQQTVAFGDSENDISMLEVVDVPVAMGNAQSSVQDVARVRGGFVTLTVRQDGVVRGLQKLGLIPS